jgi:hypothetical protein
MTKYVTKSEASLTKGAQTMIARILTKSVEDGHTAQHALRKTMGKLMGERTMSKQEKCHLIMSLPTVTCSHDFVRINLENDVNRIFDSDDSEPAVQDVQENDTNSDGAAGQQAAPKVAKMTLMDAYNVCTDEKHWLSTEEFNAVKESLSSTSFHQFAIAFTVGERGAHRNKIKQRSKQNTVLMFYPQYSSNKSSPDYTKYCRSALIKYVPWAGKDPKSLWGGEEATDADIQQAWEHHLQSFDLQGSDAPDWIRKEVEDYYSFPANRRQHNLEPEIDDSDLEPTEFAEVRRVNPDDEELNDPNDVSVQWNRDHNWSELEQGYAEHRDFSDDSDQYKDLPRHFVRPAEAAVDNGVQLNELQELAVEMIRNLVASPDAETSKKLGMLLGKGGTGKSTVINAAVREIEQMHGVGSVLKLATTGMAATVINGSTIHSGKHGLGLPVGNSAFQKLKGKRLDEMQERLKNTVLVLIDEFSMLRARELYYTDQILKQVFGNNKPFGGIAVVLIGDTGQIPAVLGRSLWDKRPGQNEDDKQGQLLYELHFKQVIELTEVKRVVACSRSIGRRTRNCWSTKH